MMQLHQAAGYFDRTAALDPDNGAELFKCQVDPYDDSKRDAGAAYRRVMSVRPGTTVAPAVRVFGDVWVVGRNEVDGLAQQHRVKYVLQPAAARASISRFADFLESRPSLESWVGLEWVKDGKELEVSSGIPQTYTAFTPPELDLRKHDIIWYAGHAFLVMATHLQPSGFLVGNCLRLEQTAPDTAAITTRLYDPVAGRYVVVDDLDGALGGAPIADGSGPTLLPALQVRWQSLYTYGSQADARYEEGDVSIVLPAGTTLDTSTLIQLSGARYTVLSVDGTAGAAVAHARPLP